MKTFDRRLQLVADRLPSPTGCRWQEGRCVAVEVVGDGTDDPYVPEPPAVCPRCGRPRLDRTVVVLRGVDVDRL